MNTTNFTQPPVLLSFSGGMDSTCLLMKYLSEGHPVTAITFRYGQKHSIELKKARQIVNYLVKLGYPVTPIETNVRNLFASSMSSLVNKQIDVPKGSEYNEENMKSTVVENRNVIFSAIIYGRALAKSKRLDTDVIISQAVHAGDHALYPDTKIESIRACQEAYALSNWGSERIRFETPFSELTKGEVLGQGLGAMTKLGLTKAQRNKILGMTNSCYSPDPSTGAPCGTCGTCLERAEAFASQNIPDPALKKAKKDE